MNEPSRRKMGRGLRRQLIGLSVLGLLALAVTVSAQNPGDPKSPPLMPRADQPPAGKASSDGPASAERRFEFQMRKKPWIGPNGVIEWLVEHTGLPFISNFNPTGAFDFVPPKGK